ncbi:HEAT repeat domain-containing protein [Alicyclobacillus sp. ALC3]|uniref:HEAT repeat domain-containing protein n=1 Tax=Alicyclobacillus sp. ALC3 TaxID=2796143 RepID=UPI00237929F5|nr:HEAT repeat domain-containing protein [Alicyclobacillus sp. ALC3]WDL95509.1 HEAT repeat domain-containing protein [Alicyclobacillus sp. ALC3]
MQDNERELREDIRKAGFDIADDDEIRDYVYYNHEVLPIVLRHFVSTQDMSLKRWLAACLAIKGYSDAIEPLLQQYREYNDDTLRFYAGWAIAVIGDKSVLPKLRKISQDERYGEDRASVIRALGKMRDKQAIPILLDLLDDDKLCTIVLYALRPMAKPEFKDRVTPLLQHDDKMIRDSAKSFLDKLRASETRPQASSKEAASKPRVSDTQTRPRTDWRTRTAKFFRDLGFYSNWDMSGYDLGREINRRHKDEWETALTKRDEHADLLFLAWDTERVWWKDTEMDVGEGNDVYIDLVQELAHISRGTIAPFHIEEEWDGPEGPIQVRFTVGDEVQEFQPAYEGDYADMNLLGTLNEVMAHTEYRYYAYYPFDQTLFVVVLTEQERDRLAQERGWSLIQPVKTKRRDEVN